MYDQEENTIRLRRVLLQNNPIDVPCMQLRCNEERPPWALISMQERDGMQDGRVEGGSNETHSMLVPAIFTSPSETRVFRPPTRAKQD